MSKRFLSGINVTGSAALNTVADAGSNTDKFLVLDSSNVVSYRTAAELYADLGIGSLPSGYTSTLKHEVKAGQTISKGQAVYVSSSDGTNMIISKASNVSEATSSKTMGLLETSLSTNGKGNVITEGLLAGLNTNGATAGDPVWLGVDGALIFGLANKPYAPAHLVFIGIVTRANANNGEIFVKVQNGFELKEIHDIDLITTTPIDGHILGYNGTLWVNKTIAGWLGYTPANDASVVKLSGAQTVGGLKTFSASIIANIGVLLKNGAVSALNGYTAIGGSSSNGIEIVFSPGGSTQSLLFQTSAAYSYTFPTATGTIALTSDLNSYVPNTRTLTINGTTYDLSANRSWTISANQNARTEYEFTTNGSTATYTATYSVGQVDVFYNGSKLSSAEFTATNGTSVTLAFTPPSGQVVEVVAWETGGGISNSRTLTINGTAYDLSANRSWTIDNASLGAQPQLNGTGFVKVSGTTVSYDNSTYLTTSSALSTYMPLSGGIFTGTTRMDGSGGTTPSITMIFNSGINRLLAPLLRLYGATNETSNYVELFGSLATQNRTIQLPDASGTIALTSNLSSYLPLSGGTLTGALSGTSATFSSTVTGSRFNSGGAGYRITAFGTLSQTVSGEMTILGHNVVADQSAANTVTVLNGGWYSSMIKMYYNEGITFHTSETVFSANAIYPMASTERIRITNGGTLGIATSSPIGGVFKLQVGDGSADTRAIIVSNQVYQLGFRNGAGSPVFYEGSDTSGNKIFSNNAGSELMRITTNGHFCIGTISPVSLGGSLGLTMGTTTSGRNIVLYSSSNGNNGLIQFIDLNGNDGLQIGSSTVDSYFYSYRDKPMEFFTNGTKRVTIQGDGQTRFQSSIILTNGQINSLGTGGGGQPMYLNFAGNGAVYAGSSYAVLYAGSDRRIKSNIENAEPTLNKILGLTPRTFKYKERPEFTNYGFIAQELEEIMPELVKTSEGITICNGEEIVNQKSIESYGLAWASILVKAMQEQQDLITELTEKVNALENK
jgi:hypothetical protein